MKTVLIKENIHPHSPTQSHRVKPRQTMTQKTPVIQRKPICACDGGCPSCSGTIQPKLKIGAPNDKYEQEADRVADQVMRMPEPTVQRKAGCSSCGELDEEEPIQAKPIGHQITPLIQRQEDEPEEEEEPVQAKPLSNKSPSLTNGLQNQIQSLKGGGQPLSESTRNFFEPRFGVDFSKVRVHTGAQANIAAKSVNAKALTTGKDVVFGSGEYYPETVAGKGLLAHELTHVLQQGSQRGSIQCKPALGGSCPAWDRGEVKASSSSKYKLKERIPGSEWLLYDFKVGSDNFESIKGDIQKIVQPIYYSIMKGRLLVIFPIKDKRLQVIGYSDCKGGKTINLSLRNNRAQNFCKAVKQGDGLVADFFKDQITSCQAAPSGTFIDENSTPKGRSRNRSVLIRVVAPKQSSSGLPYDSKYEPNFANCIPYHLATKYFNKAYANNAYCACTHTPNDPHNNCVRKCLQEKMRMFLGQYAKDLQEGTFLWCHSIWKHHKECYRECHCDNSFIDYLVFRSMCNDPFPCKAVGLSIAVFNKCKN
jgi:Domain of unknown function (DUF4157)